MESIKHQATAVENLQFIREHLESGASQFRFANSSIFARKKMQLSP